MAVELDELLGIIFAGERPEPCPDTTCKNN
jgi:hypothetical protein